jgi:hypothetical protein
MPEPFYSVITSRMDGWFAQAALGHRHVNELGVGKRLKADHVDFP